MLVELSHYFIITTLFSIFLSFFYDFYYYINQYYKNKKFFYSKYIKKIINSKYISKIINSKYINKIIYLNKYIFSFNILPKKNDNFYKLDPIYFINIYFFSFLCFWISVIYLCDSYIISDFSLINIINNSNVIQALFYKICGFWGNQEGSIILWTLVLLIYTQLLSMEFSFNKKWVLFKVFNIQGYHILFFLLFIIIFANPFLKIYSFNLNGKELNPILQDPTLVIHPPFLYFGYLGFFLLFSFSITLLRENIKYYEFLSIK